MGENEGEMVGIGSVGDCVGVDEGCNTDGIIVGRLELGLNVG